MIATGGNTQVDRRSSGPPPACATIALEAHLARTAFDEGFSWLLHSVTVMTSARTIFILDDDPAVRDSLAALLEADGHAVVSYGSGRRFLAEFDGARAGCLVVDVRMPDASGLEILETLRASHRAVPVIVITGHGDVPMAVKAMKNGAYDFIEKPVDGERLLATVRAALAQRARADSGSAVEHHARFAALTPREREVLHQLIIGRPNKVIASVLGISPRTVEIHRARVMEKLQAQSLSHLVRMALAVGIDPESL